MTVLMEKEEGIKKFANESPCLCFNMRRAARFVTQVYDTMFKEIGVTSTQAAILNSVRMLGALTVNQLAEAMATDRTTITRNLKPLVREGMILIQPGADRREREITITPKGEKLSLKVFEIWQEYHKKLEATIGKDRIEKLCSDLSDTLDDMSKL